MVAPIVEVVVPVEVEGVVVVVVVVVWWWCRGRLAAAEKFHRRWSKHRAKLTDPTS